MKKFFLTIHILFCLDFGFANTMSRLKKIILNIITVTMTLTISIAGLIGVSKVQHYNITLILLIFFIIAFIMYVLFLKLTKEKNTLFFFQMNLSELDMIMTGESNIKHNFETIMIFCCIFALTFDLMGRIAFYFDSHIPSWIPFIIAFPISTTHLILIIYSFIFYSVHWRLNKLKQNIQIHLQARTNVSKCYFHHYCRLADILDEVKKCFDRLVSNVINV